MDVDEGRKNFETRAVRKKTPANYSKRFCAEAREIYHSDGWRALHLGAHVHHGLASEPDKEPDHDHGGGCAVCNYVLDYAKDVERSDSGGYDGICCSVDGFRRLDYSGKWFRLK
jgi:hypothetical protein